MAKYGTGDDPYIDSNTGILRNKLGLTTEHALERAETLYAARGSEAWQRALGAASFDLKHLQTIHASLFGKVYDWAGEIRTVTITKGASQFAAPQYIEGAGKPLFAELARERAALTTMPPEQFAGRAAYYMGEVNALHQFREGNGRTQREFIGQLAHESGHHFRWSGIDQQAMTEASIAAMHCDTGHLERLLVANITEYGKEGMTMTVANAVAKGHHESGEVATVGKPIQQEGGSMETERGIVVSVDGANVTYAVDGGTRLIKQELKGITGAEKLERGQTVEISNDYTSKWTPAAAMASSSDYTAKVIDKPEMSEAKIQEILNNADAALGATLSGVRDPNIVGAIEADRERLDLMTRSYAHDHPKQSEVGRARTIIEAVELADIEKRKTVEFDDITGNEKNSLRLGVDPTVVSPAAI